MLPVHLQLNEEDQSCQRFGKLLVTELVGRSDWSPHWLRGMDEMIL
jgi:hypothetical protein